MGLLNTELRGRVCLFVFLFVCFFFVCPSRYDARHRKPRRCVYALNLEGKDISLPDKSPPGKRPPRQKTPSRTKAPPDKNPPSQKSPGQKCPRAKDPRGKSPPGKRPPDKSTPGQKCPGHPTSGDIFYCSGSRQLNHSSYNITSFLWTVGICAVCRVFGYTTNGSIIISTLNMP